MEMNHDSGLGLLYHAGRETNSSSLLELASRAQGADCLLRFKCRVCWGKVGIPLVSLSSLDK